MDKVITLSGRISADNAPEIENKIQAEIPKGVTSLTIDAKDLEYISSAGLRIILRLKKEIDKVQIINCSPEVFEVFTVSGFSELMDISQPFKEISIDGLKQIGQGFYGVVYRLDGERIVKVYRIPDSLDMIQRERKLAKKAFVMGIPTAIPFQIVKVGNLYGSLFELLDATPISDLISDDASIEDFCEKSVALLKKIHGTKMNPGELPTRKEQFMTQIEECKQYFSDEINQKLLKLANDIPETYTMLHSDFHVKNIMSQGNELLLIDMDTLSTGHPIFELGAMYATYVAFACVNKNNTVEFLGMPIDVSHKIFELTFSKYFGDNIPKDVVKKIATIAFIEVLFLRSKFGDRENEMTKKEIEYCIDFLNKSIAELDSLYY